MTAFACRFMPSGWSVAGLCGRRRPTGSWGSVRRNWPICSTASTGGTRFALGAQRRPAEGCDALTHLVVRGGQTRTIWDNRVVTSPETLPDDIAALQTALAAERAARQQAEARASGAEAMVAYLKLLIAKMKRERFGQSAERGRKLLDQLELHLEGREGSRDARRGRCRAARAGPHHSTR